MLLENETKFNTASESGITKICVYEWYKHFKGLKDDDGDDCPGRSLYQQLIM